MSLREQQRAMWRAVRYDPTPDDALSLFAGDDVLDARGRLAIYRNMYWYRQVDAVSLAYPRLRDRLGPERFTRLACKYIRQYPSQHPALEFLGRAMPDFVAAHAPEAAGIARLEWACTAALIAPDAAGHCGVADVDPRSFAAARLRFVPTLRCPVVDADALEVFGLTAPPQAPAAAVTVAVFRAGFAVRQLVLDGPEGRAIGAALAGRPMAEVLEPFGATPAGVEQAFEVVRGWLSRQWIEEIAT